MESSFSIDSTNVRAHQHAAGARRKGCKTEWVEDLAVADEAIGPSRGGLTSKIHLATDGRGLPMSVTLTPGQAGDNPRPLPLPDQVSVKCDGLGRPRKRPDRVLADKAHSSSSTRQALRAGGPGIRCDEGPKSPDGRYHEGFLTGRICPWATSADRFGVKRDFRLACRYQTRASARCLCSLVGVPGVVVAGRLFREPRCCCAALTAALRPLDSAFLRAQHPRAPGE